MCKQCYIKDSRCDQVEGTVEKSQEMSIISDYIMKCLYNCMLIIAYLSSLLTGQGYFSTSSDTVTPIRQGQSIEITQ